MKELNSLTELNVLIVTLSVFFVSATGTWEESRAMLSKRCRLGVATLNGKIYACGGYDGSSFLKTVEVFDPVTKKWAQVNDLGFMDLGLTSYRIEIQ